MCFLIIEIDWYITFFVSDIFFVFSQNSITLHEKLFKIPGIYFSN